MVCPALEEDAGEASEDNEDKYDFNMEYIRNIGDIMVRAGAERPCLQFKITAMVSADLGQYHLQHCLTAYNHVCSDQDIWYDQ